MLVRDGTHNVVLVTIVVAHNAARIGQPDFLHDSHSTWYAATSSHVCIGSDTKSWEPREETNRPLRRQRTRIHDPTFRLLFRRLCSASCLSHYPHCLLLVALYRVPSSILIACCLSHSTLSSKSLPLTCLCRRRHRRHRRHTWATCWHARMFWPWFAIWFPGEVSVCRCSSP